MNFATVLARATEHAVQTSRSPGPYRNHCRHFTRIWGELRVPAITPALIEDYQVERLKKVKPATILHEYAFLSKTFSWAIKRGFAESNPVKEVKAPKVHHDRCRALSTEEEKRLEAVVEPLVWSVFEFAFLTCMRRIEQLNLRQDDIGGGFARIRRGKNGRPRRVPLSARAQLIADIWIEIQPGRWLFHSEDNDRERLWRWYGYKVLTRAVKQAGIEDFTWRDFRHTGASRMAEANVSLYKIGEILGHTNPKQTLRYAHLSDAGLQEAVSYISDGGRCLAGLPSATL